MFTKLLKETSEMWNIRIAAFCLMPNHYHMLVQTPEAKEWGQTLICAFIVDIFYCTLYVS